MHVVLEQLEKYHLQDREIGIGCSGGLDSTVLIHACLKLGIKPILIHVNYQLRDEASAGDERFIREIAKKHGLPLVVKICPKALTKGEGINLQVAARNFRHALFQEWLNEKSSRRLLLAHHQDDQVETFFLQLARGAGLFGLGGMHEESQGIIRPFLNLNKAALLDFAQINLLEWREDASNASNDYARNKLRNVFIPELLKNNPRLVTSITFIQNKFREKQAELAQEFGEDFKRILQHGELEFATWYGWNIEVKLLFFKLLNLPNYVIWRIPELEQSELSASIDDSKLIRTKKGFSWYVEFPHKNTWEFKSESIGILPTSFTPTVLFLDQDKLNSPLELGYANTTSTIQKPGNTFYSNVHELLKEKGIPKQWRASYPVLKCGNEILWVPFIAVDKRFLASKSSINVLKIHINASNS